MSRDVWYQKEINKLITKIAATESEKEVADMFEVILTPREINDIARRLEAIEMLEKGLSYADVNRKLRLSPIIISRISNHIGYGFRRSNSTNKRQEKISEKDYRPRIKYKGASTPFKHSR